MAVESFHLQNVSLVPQQRGNTRSAVHVFATRSSSGWAAASVASIGASGAMIMVQPPPHYGFIQEVAHTQDIHVGPIDVFSGALLATTLLGVGVVRYRERFRFLCSFGESGLDPPDV